MSGERIKRKSILAKLMVLIMTVNLLQGMVTLPITAEADHGKNLGAVTGTENNEGITIEKSAYGYDKGKFTVKLEVEGSHTETINNKPMDLVMLIDCSGSMNYYNRIPSLTAF